MSDEGFHEIELKGKQLVFLFMAATVVSVVIFLCGVMVGRGVPAPRIVDSPALAADLTGDPTAAAQSSPSAADDDAPLSTQEVLTYSDRLDAPGPVAETLRPPVAAASNVPEPPSEPLPPAAAPVPVPVRTTDAQPARAANALPSEPAGNGYVVQVMATRTRAEADGVARRLGSKGYRAFVTLADGRTPNRYRVRVGKYTTVREADAVAQRLKKEEQFNTWITR